MNKLEKDALIKKLMNTEDDAILNQIKFILSEDDKDFWNDLPEHVKSSIATAKEELRQGKGVPHEKVMSDIKNRFFNK